MHFMAAEAFIQCRVPQAMKLALRAAAQQQQLSESALLKRMLGLLLRTTTAATDSEAGAVGRPARQVRLYVRLAAGDRQLLQARAEARCLAPATYASVLLRAHLRNLAPIPVAELRAIRQSTRELAAIGCNLNQIAHAMHQGDPGVEISREELMGLFRVCEALRDHTRAYVCTNLASWESGDAAS